MALNGANRTWLSRPRMRQLSSQVMAHDDEASRTIEIPATHAEFLSHEAARAGVSEQDVLIFALGLLAHCSVQTADSDLVIRKLRKDEQRLSFRSWAVPREVGAGTVGVALRHFALELEDPGPTAEAGLPRLRLVRTDEQAETT